MAMKIQTGHRMTHDVADVDAHSVRFCADDGRTMFEVRCGEDGRSIEVRGVDCCRVGDVLYSELIDIRPKSANSVLVRVREYDD